MRSSKGDQPSWMRSGPGLGSASKNWVLTPPQTNPSTSSGAASVSSSTEASSATPATFVTASTASTQKTSWGTPVSNQVLQKHREEKMKQASLSPQRPPDVFVHDHTKSHWRSSCEASTVSGLSGSVQPSSMLMDEDERSAGTKRSRYSDQEKHSYSSVLPPGTSFSPPATATTTPPTTLPRPFYPHKTSDVPKSALHALYGKRHKALAATDYITWHNSGPPHNLSWTSVFVCPLTGEVFMTQPFKGASSQAVTQTKDGFVWYKKKTNAEHGAAATAYDCWTFRETLAQHPGMEPFSMLLAPGALPYAQPRKGISSLLPTDIQEKVLKQQQNVPAEEPAGEMAWEARAADSTSGVFQHP